MIQGATGEGLAGKSSKQGTQGRHVDCCPPGPMNPSAEWPDFGGGKTNPCGGRRVGFVYLDA
jgi:hypothetical protein